MSGVALLKKWHSFKFQKIHTKPSVSESFTEKELHGRYFPTNYLTLLKKNCMADHFRDFSKFFVTAV